MAKSAKKHQRKAAERAGGQKTTVWVCRGCCCGTAKKHPDAPHDRLLEVARQGGRDAGAKVKVTDCLGPCGQGNIVVARAEGRIRWFRKMNDEPSTAALVAHLGAHGSLADLPRGLARKVMPKRDDRKPKH